MAQKIDNLASLDWDDTALVRAYNKGMTLRVKGNESEAGNPKGKKHNSDRKEWRKGAFCQAIYPSDGLMYEARIVSIDDDDMCTVDFLGYNEKLAVEIDSLIESGGKKARRKQIKRANKYSDQSYDLASNGESASGDSNRYNEDSRYNDDTRYNESSLMYSKKKHHHYNHGNQMLNHTVTDYNNTAAAESTFHTTFQAPTPYNPVPPSSMLAPPMPGFPPMPSCSNLSQDSSLAAMMTSWYMAGYYTGLHQVQKNQRCCCHAPQNCCRH